MSNYRKIQHGLYIVRTQAGFNQCLKDFWSHDDLEVEGYPKSYPSFVALSLGYCGHDYIKAICAHINDIKKELLNE